jgi:hypothetical protein
MICFFFFQTFTPLVDSVGLWKGPKGSKHPVEFLADLKLDFQDCNKVRIIRVRGNKNTYNYLIFVREHGVHAGPKDYFVVVVVIRGSI